jgi:hypothetical protein
VRRDEEESECGCERAETGTTTDASEEEIGCDFSSPPVPSDRPRPLVLNGDNPDAGPASFFCSKSLQRDGNNSRTKVTAAAVREHGTVNIRFTSCQLSWLF